MPTKYYRNIDSDTIYACTGDSVPDHIFRLTGAAPGTWQFLAPGSPQWDEVHQSIYWVGRVVSLSESELPSGTPAIPEPPPGPYPSPESYYLRSGAISGAQHPLLSAHVRSTEQKRITVWVVLREDTYETKFGDGEYHYLHGVHFSKKQASAATAADPQKDTKYHLRNLTISIGDEGFSFPNFKLQLYDRYEPVKVLQMLEEQLKGGRR